MILYIDPGTGSMLFSVALGILSILWYGLRKLYMKLKYINPSKGKIDKSKKGIVIYSEDKRYWTTFKGICEEFEKRKITVTYYAGSEDDPLLQNDYKYVDTACIGLGNKAYAKLNFLNCNVCLATTPGLDVYQWKKSKNVDFYIHITHCIVDGTAYRMFGTEFFDAVLFSSDIFEKYIRELETKRKSKPKELVSVGSPYMDYMMERYNKLKQSQNVGAKVKSESAEITVLLSPSWGSKSILNRYGSTIIDTLIATGFNIVIRPHPQSFISEKEMIDALKNKYPETDRLHWNSDADNFEVLMNSDIMISDYSGVVYDFAFIFEKPVLYTEVLLDRETTDRAWLDTELWVYDALPKIGSELKEENFSKLKNIIEDMVASDQYKDSIKECRDIYWQNIGKSSELIVDYLVEKNNKISEAIEKV